MLSTYDFEALQSFLVVVKMEPCENWFQENCLFDKSVSSYIKIIKYFALLTQPKVWHGNDD